jgi:TetR/AcrR family transcriptional regulator, transcriptional repressor for nem operon
VLQLRSAARVASTRAEVDPYANTRRLPHEQPPGRFGVALFFSTCIAPHGVAVNEYLCGARHTPIVTEPGALPVCLGLPLTPGTGILAHYTPSAYGEDSTVSAHSVVGRAFLARPEKVRSRMKAARRIGTESSKTRVTILDATEQLMLNEGYAAVKYRSVAVASDVTHPLVQYYFPTLDDLFLAVLKRRQDQNLRRLEESLASSPESPFHTLWNFSVEEASAALMMEFLALGNHRKTIRAEIAQHNKILRRIQLEALSTAQMEREIADDEIVAPAVVFLLSAIPKIMLLETFLGVSVGHTEVVDFMETYLNRIEPTQTPRSKALGKLRNSGVSARGKNRTTPATAATSKKPVRLPK